VGVVQDEQINKRKILWLLIWHITSFDLSALATTRVIRGRCEGASIFFGGDIPSHILAAVFEPSTEDWPTSELSSAACCSSDFVSIGTTFQKCRQR